MKELIWGHWDYTDQHEDSNTKVNHQPCLKPTPLEQFTVNFWSFICFQSESYFALCMLSVEILYFFFFFLSLINMPHYLGDSPPWEQLVGEVKGLVLLLECREGVLPRVLLGEPWHRNRKGRISNMLQHRDRSTQQQQQVQILPLC